MATAKEVKKLVKPLLERHEDLQLIGRWIFVKPIRHVARGILIDGVSYPNGFQPCWAVSHLCDRGMAMNLAWGKTIYHPVMKLWFFNDPRVPSALFDIVEEQTLPLLRSINALDDFLTIANEVNLSATFDSYIPGRIAVDIARGDLESARKLGPKLFSARWTDTANPGKVASTLWPLLETNDRLGMAKVLHEWEASEVKRLKIEKIWEPTPFPLELQDTNKSG